MTFISLLLLFIKGFLVLTLKYIPFISGKIILACSLISLFFYVNRKRVITKTILIEEYKIANPLNLILFICFITISVISTLFTFKLLNIGKSINLYEVYVYVKNIFHTTSYFNLFANFLLIIGFFLLGLMIFKFIKRIIFQEFMSIHIYLSQFDYDWCLANDYHITNDYNEVLLFFQGNDYYFTWKILNKFAHNKVGSGFKEESFLYRNRNKLEFIERHLAIITLIIAVVFDCIFNHFILTKIYYLFPFIYIYILWRLIIRFYKNRCIYDDHTLAILLYYIRIEVHKDREGIVALYEGGITLDSDQLLSVVDYVSNDFKEVINNKQIKDREEMIKNYLEYIEKLNNNKDKP